MTLTVAMGREGRKSIGEARQGHGVETHLHPEQGCSSTQEEHTVMDKEVQVYLAKWVSQATVGRLPTAQTKYPICTGKGSAWANFTKSI